MNQTDERDHAEEAHNGNLCPGCDCSPCFTGEGKGACLPSWERTEAQDPKDMKMKPTNTFAAMMRRTETEQLTFERDEARAEALRFRALLAHSVLPMLENVVTWPEEADQLTNGLNQLIETIRDDLKAS
jgi:hypothetical protein